MTLQITEHAGKLVFLGGGVASMVTLQVTRCKDGAFKAAGCPTEASLKVSDKASGRAVLGVRRLASTGLQIQY
jgi:hypothetical protein